MRHFMTLVLCLCSAYLFAQDKFTVSGYLTDASNGEPLIGASVILLETGKGTISNVYGFYSITLDEGPYSLTYSFVGYQPIKKEFELSADLRLNVSLEPGTLLEEAEVSTKGEQIQERTQMSSVTLDMQEVKTLPVLLGEQDILKTLQLMPGVQSGSEGTSGFYVRGGGPDQNLILLDGVPIYNASHLFGFFSVFNSDAIRNVELIKGGFPARYGGRLSSVLDIRMKEGNNQELKGTGSVGIISSKLTLEGPIRNENTSFLVSGRRTYIDLLTRPIIRATNGGDETGGYYFWDLNAKVNHRIDDKNRLFLSFYGGKDRAFYRFDGGNVISANELERASLSWGNAITALRWNHELNNKTFINTTATFSNYQFVVGNEFRDRETDDRDVLEYVSGIQDFGLRSDLDFTPNPNHYIKAGASATRHRFRPGVNNYTIVENSQTVIDTTFGNQDVVNYEFYAYAEDEWKISPDLTANVGVHFSGLIQDGTNFTSVQPRIALNYRVNKKHSIKAAFATMTQYLHLLTNSGIGLPTDLWLPAVDEAPPQQSNQVSIGWAHSPTPQFEVSVEGYYKHMENLIEYKNGASFFNGSREWTTKIENGIGWSYGAEVLVRKKLGEWTGWVGYTWSKSERLFDELNFGRVFPYRYDRRHDVSIAITYKPNERFDMGLVWVYGTGNSVTLEEASYFAISPSFTLNQQFTQEVNYYPDRNGYRVPAYHRMDIGFNFHKEKKWGQRTFSLGLYNAYSRQNPFFLEFSRIFDGNTGTSRQALIQYSLFPIIPSISYQFSF